MLKNLLATRWGLISTGAVIGILAALLQKAGNPGNMGICVACFERDIAGALGLHRAAVVQYMRPTGLAFTLAGGCPGRQLFLAGEGDGDAAIFVLGMIVGAAFSHNFGLASSPTGIGAYGAAGVFVGLAVCLFIGFAMRGQVSRQAAGAQVGIEQKPA